MFPYVSQIYQVNGPGIRGQFFLAEDKILKIKLSLSENKNILSWQVEGERPSPLLEKEIYLWMKDYADKKNSQIKLPLEFENLSNYNELILKHIYHIPFGFTISYQGLAKLTGKPRAARAVGNACGKNPFPLIVPCHRVLASGGKLGGYTGGLEIKIRLLEFELSA